MAVLWMLVGTHGNYTSAQAVDYLPYTACESQAHDEQTAQLGIAGYAIEHHVRHVDISQIAPTMVCLPPGTYPLRRMR